MTLETTEPQEEVQEGDGPERTCVGTRTVHPPEEMVRLIAVPCEMSPWRSVSRELEGETIAIDVARRAPGRGAWVLPEREALTAAIKRGGLARSFRRRLHLPTPEELIAAVERYLEAGVVEQLRLTRRAGALVIGESAVSEAVKQGRCRLLWIAEDTSEGNRRKYGSNADRKQIDVVVAWSGETLGAIVGTPVCRFLGVTAEPFASRLRLRVGQWRQCCGVVSQVV